MLKSKMLTVPSLLKSSGRLAPVCCQCDRKIERSKILTWPSPLRSPVTPVPPEEPPLVLIPTSAPSVAARWPAEVAVSAKLAHVVGDAPPTKVGVPLILGEVAPENKLLASAPSV